MKRPAHAPPASTLVALLLLAVVLASSIAGLFEKDPWNPLGEYPIQRITEVNDSFVHSSGVKCNDTDQPVDVRGSFGWQRVSPPGFAVELGSGTAVRSPGCERFEFDNNIPDTVRAADVPGALWRITGVEIPFRDSGEGVARAWETETFELP